MATVTLKSPGSGLGFNFSSFSPTSFAGFTSVVTTSTSLKVSANDRNFILATGTGFGGDFTDGDPPVTGTVQAFTYRLNGTDVVTLTGGNASLAALASATLAGNTTALINELLKNNDTITGTSFADNFRGANGDDSLIGLTGNDVLSGEAGSDTINGGKGGDKLSGGAASDRFVFTAGDSGQTSQSFDKITDFTKGAWSGGKPTGDVFDFSSVLKVGGSAAAATANQASIDANGIAAFADGSGKQIADCLADISARFTSATDSAGEFALFQKISAGEPKGGYYLFVSDGVAGVTANDLVVRFTSVTSISSIDLTGGDLTILS